MTYLIFSSLWRSSLESVTFADFVSSADKHIPDLDQEYAYALLSYIWNASHSGIKAIRQALSLTQSDFSSVYGIPKRSIESWESSSIDNRRTPPAYLPSLLAYAALSELELLPLNP